MDIMEEIIVISDDEDNLSENAPFRGGCSTTTVSEMKAEVVEIENGFEIKRTDVKRERFCYKINTKKLAGLRHKVKGLNLGGNGNSTRITSSSRGETPKDNRIQNGHPSPDSVGDAVELDNKIFELSNDTKVNGLISKNSACLDINLSSDLHENGECSSSVNQVTFSQSSSLELSDEDDHTSDHDFSNLDEVVQINKGKAKNAWSFLQPCTSTSSPSPKKKQFSRTSKLKASYDPSSMSPQKKPLIDFIANKIKVSDTNLFPFTPPLHMCPQKEKKICRKSVEFSEIQLSSLDALKEEGFYEFYLVQVMSFLGQNRRPPVELIQYIISHILLKSKSKSLSLSAYQTLKQIHTLFSVAVRKVFSQSSSQGWKWDFISNMVDKMEISGCVHIVHSKDGICLSSYNASLAFMFFLSVMEEEARTFSPEGIKPTVVRLLSPQLAWSNVEDVTSWLKEAVSNHGSWCYSRSICVPLETNEKYTDEKDSLVSLPCTVTIFQRVLQLSFFIAGENCHDRIAHELLYVYTSLAVERRVFLLQTIESHELRKKLIELIIENCCKSYPDESTEAVNTTLSIGKIVKYYFRKLPLSHSEPDQEEFYSRTPEEYEEFVMLLVYLIQSYIFTSHEQMQGIKKGGEDETEMTPGRHLSIADKEDLNNMEIHVNKFTNELFDHIGCPTERTLYLLELMTTFKEFSI